MMPFLKRKPDLIGLSKSFEKNDINNILILLEIGACVICNSNEIIEKESKNFSPREKNMMETIGRFNDYTENNSPENFDLTDVANDYILKYIM